VAKRQLFWIYRYNILHITYFHRHMQGGASVVGLAEGMRSECW